MKYYLPNGNEGKCPDDTALTIKDYNCSGKILSLILQNSGYFTVDGFYIRASNETDPTTKIPTITLNNTLEEYNVPGIPGRCNLQLSPFNVSSTRQFDFEYYSFNSLTRVQIQPYVITNNHLYLCKNKVTIDLQGC